jgi:hypothetical protein
MATGEHCELKLFSLNQLQWIIDIESIYLDFQQ